MGYKNLLKTIWNTVYGPKNDVVQTIEKFFHPAYEQCINGIFMKRDEYICHVQEQRKSMTINSIEYKYMMENGNELFSLYYPRGVNKDNLPIIAEVIAYFQFEKKQIIKIHGQVRLLAGNYEDVDMKNS